MKKALVALLCSLPLLANAVNVGGFEFKETDVPEHTRHGSRVYYRTPDMKTWVGYYDPSDGTFLLTRKAK